MNVPTQEQIDVIHELTGKTIDHVPFWLEHDGKTFIAFRTGAVHVSPFDELTEPLVEAPRRQFYSAVDLAHDAFAYMDARLHLTRR